MARVETLRDGPNSGRAHGETIEVEPQNLCWQDYRPCDPPQGGPDAGFCRQLLAGIYVDEELLAAGAMMRDARQQLGDFEAEHGPF